MRIQRQKLIPNIFSLCLVAASLFVVEGAAQGKTRLELRQADKIALTLTGLPLPSDMRARFIKGELSLEQIAEELSKSPQFIEFYAQFWTRTMGVQSPMDAYELRSTEGRSIADYANDNRIGTDRLTAGNEAPSFDVKGLQGWVDKRKQGKYPRIRIKTDCDDAPRLDTYNDFTNIYQRADLGNSDGSVQRAAENGIDPRGNPIQSGTADLWKEAFTITKGGEARCNDDSTGKIMQVWWDPNGTRSHARYKNAKGYRVPPWIAANCGDMLKNCSFGDASGSDVFMDEVNRDMSMEAGYLIAHTVAEDKPFKDILTTTKTIVTGKYAYFLGKWHGSHLWGNFVSGKFTDKDSDVFKQASVLDSKHYWVERGEFNAGVLTTPIYHAVTNGRRAKANRAYETFLCRKFVVPDGVQPDPADANPDLTKRAYCDSCHKSLEPMAAFFNRWPQTGSTNFIYDQSSDVDDTGRFDGETGRGASAFGQIMVKSDAFQDCSVKRAFEFINGRKLTDAESNNHLAEWRSILVNANMNLRTLMKQLVLTPEFLAPKEP